GITGHGLAAQSSWARGETHEDWREEASFWGERYGVEITESACDACSRRDQLRRRRQRRSGKLNEQNRRT
ncbi:MAG TPA: hypothetical protein VFO16_19085, partial [Pseudonocardiaceae bacterium]|nr:hypothetical protein [Pseudonocardiaceae bacterium]